MCTYAPNIFYEFPRIFWIRICAKTNSLNPMLKETEQAFVKTKA